MKSAFPAAATLLLALGGCVNPYTTGYAPAYAPGYTPAYAPGYARPPGSGAPMPYEPPPPSDDTLPPVVFQANPLPAPDAATTPSIDPALPATAQSGTEPPPAPLVVAAPPGSLRPTRLPPVDQGGSGVPLMGFRPMRGQTPATTP